MNAWMKTRCACLHAPASQPRLRIRHVSHREAVGCMRNVLVHVCVSHIELSGITAVAFIYFCCHFLLFRREKLQANNVLWNFFYFFFLSIFSRFWFTLMLCFYCNRHHKLKILCQDLLSKIYLCVDALFATKCFLYSCGVFEYFRSLYAFILIFPFNFFIIFFCI